MLLSMTGYGLGVTRSANYIVTAELKSVNGKHLDLYLKLPPHYFQQELWLRTHLTGKLVRGKCVLSLSVETQSVEKSLHKVKLDSELLLAYYAQIEAVRSEMPNMLPATMDALLQLPHVVSESSSEPDDEEWTLAQAAVTQAVEGLLKHRETEGAALAVDLLRQHALISEELTALAEFEDVRLQGIRERLRKSLNELADTFQMSEDRFHQEMIYYLEKLDINEEKVRLRAHLDGFIKALEDPGEQVGRRLNFLLQEMHREINTLGVKANETNIQQKVVGMKDALEKMKEQIMNVL